MKIYGQELRQVALRALESGQRRREVSEMLGVSVPTLDRWRREFRLQGQDASRPRGHKRSVFAPDDLAALRSVVEAAPDDTLLEHLARWQEHSGQSASYSSLRRALVRLGWSFKKRVFEPANETRLGV
jgi:transposase